MDYMPMGDGDRIAWLTNIISQIDAIKVLLGLSDQLVVEIKAYCSTAINKLHNVVAAKANYQSTVDAKDAMETMPNGELKALRTIFGQLKTNNAYTTSIGNMIGIVSTPSTLDPNTYKAAMTVSIQGDLVRLKFTKAGADSVNIYKRKKGSNEWIFLARDTSSPYDDHIVLTTPGQPEHWEYMAYGVLKDQQIGAPSDILQIIYGG